MRRYGYRPNAELAIGSRVKFNEIALQNLDWISADDRGTIVDEDKSWDCWQVEWDSGKDYGICGLIARSFLEVA